MKCFYKNDILPDIPAVVMFINPIAWHNPPHSNGEVCGSLPLAVANDCIGVFNSDLLVASNSAVNSNLDNGVFTIHIRPFMRPSGIITAQMMRFIVPKTFVSRGTTGTEEGL